MQFAVVKDPACPVDDVTVAIWCDALDKQLAEIASAWGIAPAPVVFYSVVDGLPPGCVVHVVTTSMDVPGALGYHSALLGKPFVRSLFTTPDETPATMSHENGEALVDPGCDQWRPWRGGKEQALEISDRVEAQDVRGVGQVGRFTREVWLSNWLLPSAFDPNGKAPFDAGGHLTSWDGVADGGYHLERDPATGDVADVFARVRRLPRVVAPSDAAKLAVARKLARGDSRLARRLRGV
jgi:hypothetical protein